MRIWCISTFYTKALYDTVDEFNSLRGISSTASPGTGMLKPFFHDIQWRPLEWVLFLCVIVLSAGLLTTSHYLFALLPGLVILFLLFLATFPETGYYMIIFLIPFGAYRGLSETYPFLKIHWILAFCLLLLMAFRFLVQKKASVNLRSSLWPWFLILLVISLISALTSQFPETSFGNLFLLVVSYMFFALNLMFLSPKGFSKTLPQVLILSVSIGALMGITGSVFKIPFFVKGLGAPLTRSVGASTDPNNFSLMVIFTLPLLAHWFFMSRRMVAKVFIALLFCVNILGVVFTYSRGGALVLSLTLLLLFIEHMRKFRPKHLGFVAVFATLSLLLTIILVPSYYWERQKSVVRTEEDSALARRISYLHVGWEAFRHNPLLGSGPGTFKLMYAKSDAALQFEREEDKLRRYAHNTYLEYLVGTGILGFIVFLIILRIAFKQFSQAKRTYQLRDNREMFSLVTAYQISYLSLLAYLFIFSGVYHKYLLVALALSQTAFNLSHDDLRETDGSPAPSQ